MGPIAQTPISKKPVAVEWAAIVSLNFEGLELWRQGVKTDPVAICPAVPEVAPEAPEAR